MKACYFRLEKLCNVDVLLEKDEPLTDDEKKLFGSFGTGAKIRPPFRILNPHRIFIGDYVSIREECYLHAYEDLAKLHSFIDDQYKGDFDLSQYKYDSRIEIGREDTDREKFFYLLHELGRYRQERDYFRTRVHRG